MKTIIAFLFASISLSAASVTVSWDPNPEPDVTEYRVYIGTASRDYGRVQSAGSSTTSIVENLNPGTTYFIAVTAVNDSGMQSDYSVEVVYTPPTRPSAPRNPRVQLQTALIDWRGITNRAGAVTPVLIVPGEDGVSVKATVQSPSGSSTRTVTISGGFAEFPGKPTTPPFTATADVVLVSTNPQITSSSEFK